MSIEIIKSQVTKFLESDTPEVMAIKGRWGVGKTYQWNKSLLEAKNNKKIKLEKYSYVSLFGINSLDAFKYAIFEQVINRDLIGTDTSIETFKDNIVSTSAKLGKTGINFIKSKSTTHAIESFAFLSLSETIICIDDLERIGNGLDIKNVLGLVSVLKEKKKCKIVLLLNDGEEGLDDYVKYRDKVVDIELEFSPTVEENVAIVFIGNDYATEVLKESAIKLNIKNIRVLKQIERLVNLVIPYLVSYEPEITHQAVQTLTLFAWCYYCHKSDGAPLLEYVTKIEYLDLAIGKEKDDNEEHQKWKTIIGNYGYNATDEFDLLLSKVIQTGYVIEDEIEQKADKKNKEVIAYKFGNSYRNAWDLYHSNFNDNSNEVVEVFYKTLKINIEHIDPYNLDQMVWLFRELGVNEKAEKIIDLYIESRKDELGLFNPDVFYSWGSGIKDQSIKDKFTTIYQASFVQESAEQVLESISGKNGWNPNDITILSNTSIDEYYELFKSVNDRYRLASFITTCLQFGKFLTANNDEKEIANRATEALKKIARESKINTLRVEKYGIILDDQQTQNEYINS